MPKTDTLIRTKLRLPINRPSLVARPRLKQQITQGLCGPLTLVTAPAGFGKTTLVAACLAGCGMPVAWLSLDKNDNQTGRFLTYLVAALQAGDALIGSEAAQLMAGTQPARSEAVLTSLINDLDSSGAELVLALDDYHLINNPAVHEELTFLLDHQPGGLHLVIATRSDPPLPLARLRARGQMVELRTAELRFSEDEAAQFLNEVMGLHLDAPSVALLEARTEGWIAGLQMAALSVKDRKDMIGFIECFSGTNRYILDYLLEEVLARQPAEIQHFLLHTAILERLSAPLCDALLEEDAPPRPSADILNTLERENLFLLPLDEVAASGGASSAGATWFRYHHLFADLLRARLQQAQPNYPPRLHLRASAWFEQNGFITEAIQHLVAAQAVSQAADLIERCGPLYWAENDLSIVQMAETLPHETLLDRPKLGLYLAWLDICQARIEWAVPLLNELAQRLAEAGPSTDLGWVQTVIRCAQAFLYPSRDLPDNLALDDIPADEPILRDAAEVLYGMALARRNDLDGAVTIARRCIQMASERAKPNAAWAVPSLVPFLARIYLVQGRLQAAATVCREYNTLIKERGTRFINSPGSMDIVLGEVQYAWNHLDEAEALIRDGLRANEPWENIMTNGFGAIALAHVLQAKGDISGAKQVLQAFETSSQSKVRPREFEEELRTLSPRLQLAAGDLPGAALWADQLWQSEDFQRYPERYRLTLARIRLAQARYIEVEEILASEPSQETSTNQIVQQIETHLLLASAAAGQQHLPEAFAHVAASLALAEPEGYLRVFLNMGEPARELLAACLRSGATEHKDYAQKVLAALSPARGAGPQAHPAQALVEPLSNRELEVLQLMALGKNNPEIARQLIVSPGTIKAHAASIYRKLDVANRTEAVTRARQLGLLP